jgi:hypothetical protein
LATEGNRDGTWLKVVSQFIQTGFSLVGIDDQWRGKNSNETVGRMAKLHGRKVKIFSLDIQDMYFSINIDMIKKLFKGKIVNGKENESVKLKKISLNNFLDLVDIYFKHTIIKIDNVYYTQKDGACIGSNAARLASETFIEFVDEQIRIQLGKKCGKNLEEMIRLVDDYW